ncbi:MAG: hypothetical protein JWR16_2066 [Nevskia sp.]|nr:hypothetical protein [Nevskia sp.]
MLPILDVEAAHINLEGLDKLSDAAQSTAAFAYIGELIGLVAVILIFGMPIIIVLAVLRHRARRQQATNEMVMKLADKGQPIPPELFLEPSAKPRSDLRRGIKLITVGLAMMGFFLFQGDHDAMGIGFIPLAIGIGYLLSAHFDKDKPSP